MTATGTLGVVTAVPTSTGTLHPTLTPTHMATSTKTMPPTLAATSPLPRLCAQVSGLAWYRVVPSRSGLLTVETSGYDTVAAVLRGSCDSLQVAACNDDGVAAGGGSRIKDIEDALPLVMPLYERAAKPDRDWGPPAERPARVPQATAQRRPRHSRTRK